MIWFGDEVDTTLSDQHLDSQSGLHELAYKTGGRVIRFEIDRHFGNNPVLVNLYPLTSTITAGATLGR